jgi:pimeloyl-ACP methyl ester carboxylesterase
MKRSMLSIPLFVLISLASISLALASTPVATSGDFSGFLELDDDRKIYVECSGEGGPTVLLVSGYRTRADVWTDERLGPGNGASMVLPAVATQTRVCAYDRPGTLTVLEGERFPSRSDPVPMPRTIEDVVAELHDVRELLAEDEPVVLVGHSLGGAIVRLYAATHPDDVAGIVLVDAYSEFVEANMPPDAFAAYAEYASAIPDFLADYTDYETIDFARTADVLGAAVEQTPLPAIPYVVLSKGQPFGLEGETPGFTVEQLETAWASAQAELAALLPDTPHFTVSDSSHYIQLQRPELVVAAIMQVVDEVRMAEGFSP